VKLYDRNFYATYQDDSSRSAARVLSIVFDVIRPDTVIDIGCGLGTWLAAARSLGASEILGVDGDYVSPDQLLIPQDCFKPADLASGRLLPDSGKRFDLAMTLEVAEHLPETTAEHFVDSLTALADVILFSAAIPNQGGENHINEQWPSYWAEKFADRGYALADLIRPHCWTDENVAYYYAQNAFLYVRQERLSDWPQLESMLLPTNHWTLRCVHPLRWQEANDPQRLPLRLVLRAAPHAFYKAAQRRLQWITRRS